MNGFGPLIIIPVIAIIAVIGYFVWKAERQRTLDLMALARQLGFRFDPGRDRSLDERYAHFEVFRQGHSRCARNVMSGDMVCGEATYPTLMGDYEYKVTTSNGKSTQTTTYRFSFAIVHLPFAAVPDVLIRPEGLFDKIASAVGFDDIDFESSEFSRRFYVKSPDKRFAYDLIDPRMIEFLLATSPPAIDMEQGRILITDGLRRWKAVEFQQRLQWVEQYLSHWPRHVVDRLNNGG